MDQDFHYYGTYYSAKTGGFNRDEATLIAKAANFIDFFSEQTYAAYWELVTDDTKSDSYNIVAQLEYPRYTYQGGLLGTGISPEDGLWCSYHFTPGNYDCPPNTPSQEMIHGQPLASKLPEFQIRDTTQGKSILKKYNPNTVEDLKYGKLLNRPQSALSRQLLLDAIECATNNDRLEAILNYAVGGQEILKNKEDCLNRFKLILLGIRAHVIADTWAHQDFCGVSNVMNTYWDVNYDPDSWKPSEMGYGRQSINYDDGKSGWKNKVLSSTSKLGNKNFEAVPNGSSYLGHGWMGHMPDFSFVKFGYKPCWASPHQVTQRDNRKEYLAAWLELTSLFNQANGNGKIVFDQAMQEQLHKAQQAIETPCKLEQEEWVAGRKVSADAWKEIFEEGPTSDIDVVAEPHENAVLNGLIEGTKRLDRYGKLYVNVNSDLYLFQIAADYHFHFVKSYLDTHNIYKFTGSWSQQTSALSEEVTQLFEHC
jgi:hypothetical protein